jgi:hypothetical protein
VYTIWIHQKKNSGTKILQKKEKKHNKLNYGRHPLSSSMMGSKIYAARKDALSDPDQVAPYKFCPD